MTPSRYTACIGRRAVYDVRKVAGSTANKRSDVLGAGSNIQRGAVACGRIDIDFRPLVIDIIGNAADDGSVGGDILQRHIDLLTRVSRDGPLIAGSAARRVPRVLKVVQVCEIAGASGEKFCGDRAAGLQCSVTEKILFDGSRLGGDDGRIACSGRKALLNLRHRLLGGGICEHLGPNLCTVVARGGLLRAGAGEKRGDDRGQQHNHE